MKKNKTENFMRNHDKYKMLLSAYIDGEIKNTDLDKLFEHLEECSDCKKYLEEIQKIRLCVRQTGNEEFDISNHLEQIIQTENAAEKVTYKRHLVSYAFAAAFVLFVFVSAFSKISSNFSFSSNSATSMKSTNIWPSVGDLDKEAMSVYYAEYV